MAIRRLTAADQGRTRADGAVGGVLGGTAVGAAPEARAMVRGPSWALLLPAPGGGVAGVVLRPRYAAWTG